MCTQEGSASRCTTLNIYDSTNSYLLVLLTQLSVWFYEEYTQFPKSIHSRAVSFLPQAPSLGSVRLLVYIVNTRHLSVSYYSLLRVIHSFIHNPSSYSLILRVLLIQVHAVLLQENQIFSFLNGFECQCFGGLNNVICGGSQLAMGLWPPLHLKSSF